MIVKGWLVVLDYATFRFALSYEVFAQKKNDVVHKHSTGTEFLFNAKCIFLKNQ